MRVTTPRAPRAHRELGERGAVLLAFSSSAAVLVVELVALRLLAPYLGLTLETNTLVIGVALTAIALGSWAGGRAADVMDPRRALGSLFAISGAVTAVTPFLVRGTGEVAPPLIFLVAALMILVPGALLSAVTPMVTKLRLRTLDETGSVVGRLSGVATVGSILGTVLTGLVLVSRVPVSAILVGLGALLVVGGVAVQWWLGGRRSRGLTLSAVVLVAGGLGAVADPGGCDVETTYHCVSVVADPERESSYTLVLDGLRHSYVDLDDRTHLEFAYVRAMAAVADTAFPAGETLRSYHLGGGGMTLPHYLEEVRPGGETLVSEIDGGVVRVDQERLGLEAQGDVEVLVEDARLGLERRRSDSRDLVVGDAFGGVSVPWHLTTREALTQIRRVLTDDGVYVANVIDHGPLAFARAEVATLREVFTHVAVLGEPADLGQAPGGDGGNLVLVASDRPLDLGAIQEQLDARDTEWSVLSGGAVDGWLDGAMVLTDDHAPVDQLATPYP